MKPNARPVTSFHESLQQFLDYCGGHVLGHVRIQGQTVGAIVERKAFGQVTVVDGQRLRDLTTYLGVSEKVCVMFKRAWYRHFSRHFRLEEGSWGQVANKRLLYLLQDMSVSRLVAVMPDGVAYAIPVKTFIRYYEEHHTDVPHLPGEIAAPIRLWTREYPL